MRPTLAEMHPAVVFLPGGKLAQTLHILMVSRSYDRMISSDGIGFKFVCISSCEDELHDHSGQKEKRLAMRFIRYLRNGRVGLAISASNKAYGLDVDDPHFPGDLDALIEQGPTALAKAAETLQRGDEIDLATVNYLPVLGVTGKIVCLGINYVDHVKETGNEVPAHPTIFTRFSSSLIGHKADLIRPRVSTQFDYEGELVAVIGRRARHVAKERALDYVCGYTIFNDASVRDYQFDTTQWTVGKNFDGTGAIGPAFVTADEVPQGGKGLKIETRLNGSVVQQSNTDNMIYDVATCISYLSDAFAFEPGDILVMGTPPGVGWARKPQLFMKPGDTCEVEIQGLGTLINGVSEEEDDNSQAQR